MRREKITLLSNGDADSAAFGIAGGRYIFAASATWAGGSLQLQFLGPDGTTYINVDGAVLAANGAVAVDIAGGSQVKAVIGGAPTAIYAALTSVPLGV